MSVQMKNDTPVLRAGIMTDTHIGKTEQACRNIRNAFSFFKKNHIDLMIHTGDIADLHYPEGYRIARRYFNEIFSENQPKELWVYAWHDSVGSDDNWEQHLKKLLQIPNDPYDEFVFKGYPFLVFPQRYREADYEKMEKMIRDAVRNHPGKPVIVLDHIPPYGTTENSNIAWGDMRRREIMDRYPQVIVLSGHTHNSLRNERCIWQGNFTTVNCGCIQCWEGTQTAEPGKTKPANEAVIMEIFPDRILFRCYSLENGREIRPDHPWCIPWPFDPAEAPYDPERRAKTSPEPYFPQKAGISMKADRIPFSKLTFTFPEALHPERCYRYKFTLNRKNSAGGWEILSCKDNFAGFYLEEVPSTFSTDYDAGFFEENGEYLLSVTPVDFYGRTGKPIELEFRSPTPQKGMQVFESRDPMREIPFRYTGGDPVRREGGSYLFTEGEARLLFPDQVWDGPKGTRFRFIIDFSIEQPKGSSWIIARAPIPPWGNILTNTPEKSKRQRNVFEITKTTDDDLFCFLIRDGYWDVTKKNPGKIAFEYVRIEKINQDGGAI